MEKSLTDILREVLVGKPIKLYKVSYKEYNKENYILCYITNKEHLFHIKGAYIIGETHGFVKKIETEEIPYEGDIYNFSIVDGENKIMDVRGLESITSKLEIL